MTIRVRPTGVLIEDGRMLLVRQRVYETRKWSMPGGGLEHGETIESCLKREMMEETGLAVRVKELLYVSERLRDSNVHIVYMMFLVEHSERVSLPSTWSHEDPAPSISTTKSREIRMVPIDELVDYGFPFRFQQVIKDGFPSKGSYIGDFNDFFGETSSHIQ